MLRRPPREGAVNEPPPPPVVFTVWDEAGNQIYQSEDWPDDLAREQMGPFPALNQRTRDLERQSFDAQRPPRRGRLENPRRRWDPEQEPEIWDSDFGPGPGRPGRPDFQRFGPGRRGRNGFSEMRFADLPANGSLWKVGMIQDRDRQLALAARWDAYRNPFWEVRMGFIVLSTLVLGLAVMGGWWISHRAIRPVEQITQRMESITVQGLHDRLTAQAHDREMQRLVDVFNQMLDRLQKSFAQASRFSADASHELKTPLAILQGQIEAAVQKAEADSEEQGFYLHLLEETSGLKSLVDKLLLLAQADSGRLQLTPSDVSLRDMVEMLAEDAEVMNESIRIETRFPDSPAMVHADEILIQRALSNLIQNAVKYNHPEGIVRMELVEDNANKTWLFRIDNTGPGIAATDRNQVFDRFFRVDTSRNRQIGGVGLGLSLAREIILAHQGEIRADSFVDQHGENWTRFEALLPG